MSMSFTAISVTRYDAYGLSTDIEDLKEEKVMKATGIVRRVDDLGRIVIPKNVRTEQGITEGTPMEIFTEDGAVIFKKNATYLEEE